MTEINLKVVNGNVSVKISGFEVGADEFREMMNESVKVDSVDVAELKKQMEARQK